ncbi:discoidin domain-containing protein [Actinoplanes sp. NPDC051861]|uniref:discoidin domain-containing protein n=1 Tax=Actinoplanes sp. NPDC051861 TaxID=3155170 RepID=UPI003437C005
MSRPAAVETGKANPSRVNLALRGTATASGSEGDPWLPANAIDGDDTTRWSSAFTDSQWLRIDLTRRWQLSEVTLFWEHAHAVSYRVEASLDGRSWKTLWSTKAGQGGTVRVDAGATVARYVRIYGVKRSGIYGYSLLEVEIR